MDCNIQQPPPSTGMKALTCQWTAIFRSHLHPLDRKCYRINELPYLIATSVHWIESVSAPMDCHIQQPPRSTSVHWIEAFPRQQSAIFSSYLRLLDRKCFRINGLLYLVATSIHWIEIISMATDCHIQQPPQQSTGKKALTRQWTAIFSSHLHPLDRKRFHINGLSYLKATSVHWIESVSASMDCHIQDPPPPIGQKAFQHQWTAIFSSHLNPLDRKRFCINGLPYLGPTSTHWIESVTTSTDCHIQQPPPVHWLESVTASKDSHIWWSPPPIGQKVLPRQWTPIFGGHLCAHW